MYKAEIVANKVEKQVRREIEIQSNLRCVRSSLSLLVGLWVKGGGGKGERERERERERTD